MSGIYALYADVLDYPTPRVFSRARELSGQTAARDPEASALIRQFESALSKMTLAQLQEIYTSCFDLHPDSTPNLGCHLFGEDARRNIFMAQLKERMDRAQVSTGVELPDHLSVVLRLLDSLDDEDEIRDLVEDCLVPGVNRILSSLKQMSASWPYAAAFEALLVTLKSAKLAATASPETARGAAD